MLRHFSLTLVDLTTSATPASMRPIQYFSELRLALSEQVENEFSATWGKVWIDWHTVTDPAKRDPRSIAVNCRDTIPEAPGALAYHAVAGGVPDIELGIDLFTSALGELESVSGGMSHEVLEMLADPGANQWADKGTGVMCSYEACDVVQNTGYRTSNGVWVSNFLRPNYFIPGANGPYDYLGLMASQGDISNGYEIQCAAPNDVQQVGGEKNFHCFGVGVPKLSELQRKRKLHPHSRAYRRGLRLEP